MSYTNSWDAMASSPVHCWGFLRQHLLDTIIWHWTNIVVVTDQTVHEDFVNPTLDAALAAPCLWQQSCQKKYQLKAPISQADRGSARVIPEHELSSQHPHLID